MVMILTMLFPIASCRDELLYDPSYVGEGEATIDAELSFYEITGNLNTRADENNVGGVSGGTDGNAIGKVNSLCVLLYKTDGTLLRVFNQSELADYVCKNTDDVGVSDDQLNTDSASDAISSDQHQAESKTAKASFKLTGVPYGKYRMYAVANMGDLSDYEEAIQTEVGLKNISLTWNNDVAENNQMFGYFTEANSQVALNPSSGFNAHDLTVNNTNIKLHAWLKRAVSKVTVAFNGERLKDNIFIFIKSVEIKDIPENCLLGADNPGIPSSTEGDSGNEVIFADQNQIITYNTDLTGIPSVDNWQYVSNGNPILGAASQELDNDMPIAEQLELEHGENVKALYFFENLQGLGKEGTESDKRQQVLNDKKAHDEKRPSYPNGINSDDKAWKDAKKFGSYIEVKAYYRSNNTECLGQGEIIYRFMLGQDVIKDYNAKRNYHYKLTLCFNGYGNDVDWHIEYDQENDLYIPDPYYISYLYDKSMELPVQILGDLEEGTTLHAEIISNEWIPFDYFENKDDNDIRNEYFNPENSELSTSPTDNLNTKPTEQQYKDTQRLYYGFLSLTNPGARTQVGKGVGLNDAAAANENYWTGNSQGVADYDLSEGSHTLTMGGSTPTEYSVKKDGQKNILMLPLFTRPKNLVKTSGYTGNNPYVSYQRKAIVKFTLMKGGVALTEPKEVEIIQVRRLVNPKGIWRDWDEDEKFDVHLLHLESEYTQNPWESPRKFESFTSIGPWSAEVLVQGGVNGSNWIVLSPLNESKMGSDGKIYGDTGSTIDFTFKPASKLGNKDQVRYGIIRVRYHNYTCEHLIFVRQGYAPISIIEEGAKWYSFNMRSQSEMTQSPCEEGSIFKRFRWDKPILPQNNIKYPFRTNPGTLDLYGGETAKWDDWYSDPSVTEWEKPTVEGQNMKVASVDDYINLYDHVEVQQGYGILYDGNADGVQYPLKDAYSYYSDYQIGANGDGNGMRGCFIYNEKTGANIFLPIGASGFGRRRCQNLYNWPGTFYPGMLIYANRNTFMQASTAWKMPLLFDLFRRPGATYWTIKTEYKKEGQNPPPAIDGDGDTYDVAGWDFNYITFDFYPIAESNLRENNNIKNSDALPIRCIVDETPSAKPTARKKKK